MSAETLTTPAQPRGAIRLIADPTFGTLFWGKMFAVIAVYTHCIVAAIVIYDATRSALMVGLVGVLQFGPQLILTPTSGKWADRGNPVRQILIGRTICVIGSGFTAAWLFLDPTATGTAVAIPVLVGSLVLGLGFVVGGPAMQSIVPNLIRTGELSTAMALNSFPMTVGRVAGPAAGAFIAAHLGAAAGFAFCGALHFIFVVFVLLAKLPSTPKPDSSNDFRVRAAVKYVLHDRPLLLALVAVTAIGLASDPSITLTPSLADLLGGGTQLVGVMSAAFGIGAAVGMIVLALIGGRIASAWVSSLGVGGLGAGLALLAVASTPTLAVIGFTVAGLGFGWAMTGLSTVVQERAPQELRGRIMALWLVGFVGSRPLAALLLGGGADAVGVHAAFAAAAALTLAVAALCRPSQLTGPLPAESVRPA